MLSILVFLSVAHSIRAGYVISIHGDVYKDKVFFTRTFPWIVDNIGGDIQVEYKLLGSGRYSVPQMCALQQLARNTFLQASYLKCEAEGKPSKYCLCETGIDAEEFRLCVANNGYFASHAAAEHMRLNVRVTPLMELGVGSGSTVFGVSDELYLRKLCSMFEKFQPLGCHMRCNGTKIWMDRPAIAQFHKDCGYGYDCHQYSTTTTTVATTATPTDGE